MTTVTPKLYYDRETASQVPVWEIVTPQGNRIYYERVHHHGHRPVGCIDSCIHPNGDVLNTVDTVRLDGRKSIFICKEADGYIAPMSWYERLDGTKGASSGDFVRDGDSGYSDDTQDADLYVD